MGPVLRSIHGALPQGGAHNPERIETMGKRRPPNTQKAYDADLVIQRAMAAIRSAEGSPAQTLQALKDEGFTPREIILATRRLQDEKSGA